MDTNCQLPHRDPKGAIDGHLVCPGHRRWLADTLDDIVITYALLPHFYEPGTAVDDGQQVRGKRVDPPQPQSALTSSPSSTGAPSPNTLATWSPF